MIPSDLSPKQREVLERLSRHQSIKTMADEMKVSSTRINQHIRSIKDRMGVNSQEEMVAGWIAITSGDPFRKNAYRNRHLSEPELVGEDRPKVDTAVLQFRDAGAFHVPAPWELKHDRVGPGFLDGPGATAKRMGFIALIAIGFPIAVVVVLSAMMALGEALRAFH